MSRDTADALWLDFVADLLQEPLSTFPHERVAMQLASSFDVNVVSWEWRESPTCQGGELFSETGTSMTRELMEVWHHAEIMNRHPLVQWFVTTGDPRAQTAGRVPTSVAPARDVALMREHLGPHGVAEQVAIPYRFSEAGYAAFVLGRPEDDFDDDDLRLARRLQALLSGLARQARAVDRYAGGAGQVTAGAAQVHLTGTEVAVLALLAEGHTALGIAHRLGNSPRTVGKHLEHIYRKLGVRDRLLATRVARDLGLLKDE